MVWGGDWGSGGISQLQRSLLRSWGVSETDSWFFEMVIKVDKLLSRLIKKKRERAQVNKIRNKREVKLTVQKYKGLSGNTRSIYMPKNWTTYKKWISS